MKMLTVLRTGRLYLITLAATLKLRIRQNDDATLVTDCINGQSLQGALDGCV